MNGHFFLLRWDIWVSSHEHLPLLTRLNHFLFPHYQTCFLSIHLWNKYHSTLCQCLITNMVTAAAVLSRTNTKPRRILRRRVGCRPCLNNAANSPELIHPETEDEGCLEDGPTNTYRSHVVLVALNTRKDTHLTQARHTWPFKTTRAQCSASAEGPEYVTWVYFEPFLKNHFSLKKVTGAFRSSVLWVCRACPWLITLLR